MVITHHGGQCFKVTFGDLTLVFDPVGKGASLPAVRFGAGIALVSRNHPDFNGVSEVSYGDPSNPLRAGKVSFVISGPGEYERQGVTVQGFLSKSKYGLPKGEESALNTIYAVELEDMTLVHLGALADKEFPAAAREAIDEVDVLFVPIGVSPSAGGVLTPAAAHELAVALEPKLIIPMHWQGMGAPKSLETFIKEAGNGSEKMEKLTLKKKDLAGRDGSILILTV